MNIYAIVALINLITSSALGSFVFLKGKRKHLNNSFSLFALSISVWSIGYFFWQLSTTAVSALFWSRVLMAGAIFTSVTYLHFVLVLVNISKRRRIFLWLSYILFSIFWFINFTPLFVEKVEPILHFRFWPIPGPVFNYFIALWFIYAVAAVVLLAQYLKRSQGILKSQIRYILIATIIGYAGGLTNYFLWYKIPIVPFGNIAISLYILAVVYAIIRYRLMDIRMVWRNVFMYFGLSLFLYFIFFFLIWLYTKLFGGIFIQSTYIASLFVAPIVVFIIHRIISSLNKIANTYVFANLYSYQDTIKKLAEELSYTTDINVITESIVTTLNKIGIDHVAILDVDNSSGNICNIDRVEGFSEMETEALSKCSLIVQYLDTTHKPLVRDEIDVYNNSEMAKALITCIDESGLALCLPLTVNEKLSGIIALGPKSSGDGYNSQDLELLNTLSYQAGIALENARLYKEVQDFNATLKEKVDEQTKDIKVKAEKLERLLKVKSEFIYLMSHQLRTPISVITGMASMLKEGDLEDASKEKRQEFMDGIYVKSKKLADILNDFIKAEQMDGEDFKFNADDIKKIQLEDLVKTVCDNSAFQANEKKIELTFEPVATPTPAIKTDPHYLEQAVTNIVDNAIKYTQQGSVKVKVYSEGNNAVCEVTDSGIGIPEADKPKLFDKFIRAKNAVDAYAYGTGLGLFIARKIVEAHKGGTITFTSEQNKGTTFKISIPAS